MTNQREVLSVVVSPVSVGPATLGKDYGALSFGGNMTTLTQQDRLILRGVLNSKIEELQNVLPGSGFLVYDNAVYMAETLTKLRDKIK